MLFGATAALACGPINQDQLESSYERVRPNLDRLAVALRESDQSMGVVGVRDGWLSSCEVRARGQVDLARDVEDEAQKTLCPLLSGLAVNAFVDEQGSVWLMTWEVGGPGDYGGYVLPGSDIARRDFTVDGAGRFRFSEVLDGGWMIYENL